MTVDPLPPPAPWDAVPSHEQFFVLITGANSGIGLGIAQRLMDEFLATRSLTSHLILLLTTRSSSKSLEVVASLRRYAQHAAQTSPALRSRSGPSYRWQDTVARVHVLSLPLDLCDLRAVSALGDTLCRGTVGNPPGLEGEYLANVRIPRLDAAIFNAAYGGWSGPNWVKIIWLILTEGFLQTVTWPAFKNALPTCILNESPAYRYPQKPLLSEVFCACVFGHYLLARRLLPLLSRRSEAEAPGRIVWSSSVDAIGSVYNPADLQCFLQPHAYESSKRLIDLIGLTCSLPAVVPYSSRYLQLDEGDGDAGEKVVLPPRMYVSHPGVVASALFPVPWFLFWVYQLALTLARFLGSPWHNVNAYSGAKSAVWITLQDREALDEMGADRVKWGSASNRRLESLVKRTEVEGWGWEGKPESDESIRADEARGVLHKSCGRRAGTRGTTAEDIAEFEELGAQAWAEMEKLRNQWEVVLQAQHL